MKSENIKIILLLILLFLVITFLVGPKGNFPLNDEAWGSLNLDPKNIGLIVEEMERQYAVAVDFVLE